MRDVTMSLSVATASTDATVKTADQSMLDQISQTLSPEPTRPLRWCAEGPADPNGISWQNLEAIDDEAPGFDDMVSVMRLLSRSHVPASLFCREGDEATSISSDANSHVVAAQGSEDGTLEPCEPPEGLRETGPASALAQLSEQVERGASEAAMRCALAIHVAARRSEGELASLLLSDAVLLEDEVAASVRAAFRRARDHCMERIETT